ncbi:MAG TPA: TRAP transporter TatT component family protein, partial [Blastocatellia bacterium]|nr:TRAP transporter TatT component family protein [Blastocatellia bacterium]
MPKDHASISAGQHIGPYRILAFLGKGGMGEVYLAQDGRLGRKVALKLLPDRFTDDEERVRRFRQEARAASALNHPNIVTIYEIGQADGVHFIATEYIEGETLRSAILNREMPLGETLDVAIQVATGLAAAHQAGILHRDIKPENIMLRPDGYAKILDFGLAKLTQAVGAREAPSVSSLVDTAPGVVMGTVMYLSPEQARNLEVDARTDLFSLGVVLYEMLTRRPPFAGETFMDVIAAILQREPPPLTRYRPEVPSEIQWVVNKALCKDRARRYQTAKELLSDLKEVKEHLDTQARAETVVSPAANGGRVVAAKRATAVQAVPTAKVAKARRTKALNAKGLITVVTRHKRRTLIGLAVLVVALIALVYFGFLRNTTPSTTPASLRKVAILPFRNLRPDAQTDFLSLSLADAIITKLSYVKSLVVRPSSYVGKYRNQDVDPQQAADELNVDTLLVGNYLKDADDLRITAQLFNVKAGEVLWADTINLKYEKLLTVQERVAEQVIKGMQLSLTPAETANLRRDVPQNPQAYEYHLRGIALYYEDDLQKAIAMLEKATELDPNYALSWAYLGSVYTTTSSVYFGGNEDHRKAQAAYERALALNPEQLEARIFNASLLTNLGRVEEAVPLLREALKINPNLAQSHWELAYAYRFAGMVKESISEGERAREIESDLKATNSVFNGYLYDGKYERFIKSLPARTDSAFISFYRGLGYYYLKDRQRAADNFDRAYALNPTLLQTQVGKALSHALAGRNQAGVALLRKTEQMIEERGVSDAEGIYKVAQAYAALGDKASALRVLRRSIEGGFFCYPYFLN